MKNKTLIIFVSAIIIFLIPLTHSMIINVEIKSTINGRSDYNNFTTNPLVGFKFSWENIGSVDCNTRLRMDLFSLDNKKLKYTSWSDTFPLAPGDTHLFEVYALPEKSGNYNAKIKLYYCNEIYPISSFNFTFNKTKFKPLNLSLREESTKNYVEFKIIPYENISTLYIIPKNYPEGWVFESLKASNLKANKETSLRLSYKPAVWMPRTINFTIITDDHLYKEVSVTLEKRKEFPLFPILLVLLFTSLLLNFYLGVKRLKNK